METGQGAVIDLRSESAWRSEVVAPLLGARDHKSIEAQPQIGPAFRYAVTLKLLSDPRLLAVDLFPSYLTDPGLLPMWILAT